MRIRARAVLLLLLACIGLLAGVVGERLTGDSAWFLAIPVAVAIGWLFVADPTACTPPGGRRPH